ncbi:DUF4260 domain-containing protein [Microvirga sp. 2TAF3]|uniref:DUF4260 domain-containing protein n=1 Tax=Microvirga sp. 2TAF3 TaxID=3233014 RepID=UPI003F9B72CB
MSESTKLSSATGAPRTILRLEGLALLALATAAYAHIDLSWWPSAALFLVPDLGFVADGAGPRPGAMIYNILHTTIGPALPAGIGLFSSSPVLMGLAAIWAAHIGFDRMLEYGLKYATGFSDIHLGRIGRQSEGA